MGGLDHREEQILRPRMSGNPMGNAGGKQHITKLLFLCMLLCIFAYCSVDNSS